MASWWTVVLILQIGALWEYTHATSCTAVTKNTCTPTLQVTGTCTSEVCDCKSGFVTTRTGCSGTITPKINIIAISGPNGYPGNGEVLEGGPITLRCNPDYGNGQYIWKQGNTVLSNTNRDYAVTAAATSHTGSYTCKIKLTTNDFETAESSPVTVTVVASAAGSFAIAPTVLGMPPKALTGESITLQCGNLPSGQQLTFQWFKNTNTDLSTTTQTYTFTQAGGSDTYTCTMVRAAGITATFTSATSTAVSQPTIPTTITGVYLSSAASPDLSRPKPDVPPVISAEAGSSVAVYCAVNDTDLYVLTSTSLTYKWKKNSIDISGETSRTFTKTGLAVGDAGSYQCEATLGTTPYLSNAVQLSVESTIIDAVDLVVIPTTPVLTGYAVLDCRVKIADLRRVSYRWTINSIPMPNINDRALQINNLVASDNTAYACTANVGFDSASDSITLSAPALGSATPAVTSLSAIFGVGNKYTLTCGEAYTIPGLTYRWYEDDNIVSGQTSKTYELTVKAGTKVYKCDIALGTTISSKSIPGLTVAANPFSAVNINVGTITLGTTYLPLTATSVTLTCVATMAAGATGTVTYSWTKDSGATGSGTSTLTFMAGAATNGAYKCKATLDSGNLESPEVTVTAAASLSAPTIGTTADRYSGDQKSYSEGADYDLTCESSSYSPDMQFVWTKDTVNVGTSRVYKITNANKVSSGGSFTCSVTLGTSTVTSAAVTITIGEKGKPCEFVDDCEGDQYDDVCLSNRCVCATGYALTGNTCSGQGIVTISMLLLVLCGLIKLIL